MSEGRETPTLSDLVNYAQMNLEAEGTEVSKNTLRAWFDLARELERVKAVYVLHREELDYVSDQKQKYNTVNRNVMTKTVRRFVYDMEVALRGDPVVYKKEDK